MPEIGRHKLKHGSDGLIISRMLISDGIRITLRNDGCEIMLAYFDSTMPVFYYLFAAEGSR